MCGKLSVNEAEFIWRIKDFEERRMPSNCRKTHRKTVQRKFITMGWIPKPKGVLAWKHVPDFRKVNNMRIRRELHKQIIL